MKDTLASLRRSKNLTQIEVAGVLGITRHMLMRIEQGIYTDLVHYEELANIYEMEVEELQKLYRKQVQNTRDQFALKYPDFKTVLKDYSGTIMPLTFYRNTLQLTQIGFCKGLCVHPDPIRDYELNEQRGIPMQLVIACNSVSWDYGALESAVVDWRISGRANAKRN